MQSIIINVSRVKYCEYEVQRARIIACLGEGELNPNNRNRKKCAREYLLSVKQRIRARKYYGKKPIDGRT